MSTEQWKVKVRKWQASRRIAANRCSKARPCPAYNPMHVAMYGECWWTRRRDGKPQ